MIPNLLNSLLGITLVYCAILATEMLHQRPWALLAGGVSIIVFAMWARMSDELKWFSRVNAALGAALVVLGIARTVISIPPLLTFWWAFWVGCIVAVLACWSALYTRAVARVRSSW